MQKRHIQHLYFRAGFGIDPDLLHNMASMDKPQVIERLFSASKYYKPINLDLSGYEALVTTTRKEIKENPELYRNLIKRSRIKLKELNSVWLERLCTTDAVFNEKMTLFWANIFVCKDNHIYHVLKYNNTLRKHALGNFRVFVKAIAREASMSKYLNNRQNVKRKPNENFARELMELFTLGEDNYSETDIKEAARAFTGWSFKPNGDFLLRKQQHDYGKKTIFDETGNFDGDQVIDIILKQKQCAKYICSKIYRYFINPKIDEVRLVEITDVFYKDYDIKNVMLYIFSSDWFYDNENIGVKIKSPIELIVGIQKVVPFHFKKPQRSIYIQKIMGQVLLNPPNVAGWKQDRNWIDGNTLMFRLKLASVVLNDAVIDIDVKGEFEDDFENYYKAVKNRNHFLKTERSWANFNKNYNNLSFKVLKSLLIITSIDRDTDAFLELLSKKNPKEYLIQLMSIPEYQLC
ncbi:DUF1800 domain-containing protein [uncultured Aquimarina sp.]|uniref:DUF1800 domain-containing protein n=1 Tax=uncultured Aquimarina sp. TaxID=575652 RepID=UPI002618F473|nr:DUF1800 domain-containing protein [uncultured Aquimarina sp.]